MVALFICIVHWFQETYFLGRARGNSFRLRGANIGMGTILQNGVRLFGCKNIQIGADCFFGRETKIFAYKSKICIGSKVIVAENVKFISHEHKFADSSIPISDQGYTSSPITVGNDVWIGFNCIILPGVTIGDGVVIGAGSIVNSDIPDNYIAAGSPARIIRHREQ